MRVFTDAAKRKKQVKKQKQEVEKENSKVCLKTVLPGLLAGTQSPTSAAGSSWKSGRFQEDLKESERNSSFGHAAFGLVAKCFLLKLLLA